MKKIPLVFILLVFAVFGTLAKDNKFSAQEKHVEISFYDFFCENFSVKKDVVYKITNTEFVFDLNNEVRILSHYEIDLKKILTDQEKERIREAKQYDAFKANYIIYVQTKKNNPMLKDIKVIRVENIPTYEELEAEENRLEAERIAEEKRKSEERAATLIKVGGYDNLPWGTTIEEFLQLVPIAEKLEDEGCLVKYSRKGSTENSELIYKFFEEKLVGGETKFEPSPKDGLGDAINRRLVELYGKPNDTQKTQKHYVKKFLLLTASYTEHHIKPVWNKSPTFRISLDICLLEGDTKKDQINILMFVSGSLETFTVYYDNPSMSSKIAASNEKQKKEKEAAQKAQEEAERRQKMDSLDL